VRLLGYAKRLQDRPPEIFEPSAIIGGLPPFAQRFKPFAQLLPVPRSGGREKLIHLGGNLHFQAFGQGMNGSKSYFRELSEFGRHDFLGGGG
jgi:hypothetical protein